MVRRIYLFFHLVRNLVDYPLRQLFHWRRNGLRLKNESKETLFNDLKEPDSSQAQAAAQRLLETYHLDSLYSNSTQDNYRENLYYLDMLESSLNTGLPHLPPKITAADIGPSHWFYVKALYAALKWWQFPQGREVTLFGFERDAYRVYSDLYSRYDHALAHSNHLLDVTYIPHGFEPQPNSFDIITQLFPFIFLSDHLEWGLPLSLFNPAALLASVWVSLKPGGLLIIANQGKQEHEEQTELLRRVNIPGKASYLFNSLFYRYDQPRYITIACKENE